MKIKNPLTILLLLFFQTVSAQFWVIKGQVADSTSKTPLPSATVILKKLSDQSERIFAPNLDGEFRFTNVLQDDYRLVVSYVGFKSLDTTLQVRDTSIDLGMILLAMDTKNLGDVTVEGLIERVRQNGDTTEYNADAFKVNPDATAENLVEKMPGVIIQNGQVQAQGENVSRVLVDGREFFGDDPNAALKNLPAEMIERIQIYDQASDQAQFTGFLDGETTKTMNIITRVSMRNGEFGRVYAGGGTDETYKLSGSINLFRPKTRTTILGQMNNINIQNFSTSDLLGMAAGGGRRGGGRGGAGGGRGGAGGGASGGGDGGSDFLVGQQDGISDTKALGINYSYEDNKKFKFSGSYFFNQSDNVLDENIFRQFTIPENEGQTFAESSSSPSRNINHRFSGTLEYKFDDKNSIIMRPRFTLQDNSGSAIVNGVTMLDDDMLNRSFTQNQSDLMAYSFNNNLLFRHAFEKKGRTLSLNVSTAINENTGDAFLLAENEFFTRNPLTEEINQFTDTDRYGLNMTINATYTEPIGERNQLSLGYRYGYQYNDSEREVFSFNESNNDYTDLSIPLTSTFENDYITHRAILGFNKRGSKSTLTLRANFQSALLANEQVFPVADNIARNFNNFLPSVVYRHRFGTGKSFNFNYRTSTNAPSVGQLQNVIDNSNPLNISEGNPELDQTYQHSATIRYNAVNAETSQTFFTLVSASFSNNEIGNSVFIASRTSDMVNGIELQPGASFTQPVNLNGAWNIRSFISYGLPLGAIRSNLNFTGTISYNQTPELINEALNFAQTPTAGLGLVLSSNISEKVDFTLSTQSSFSSINNTLTAQNNTDFFNHITRLRLNLIMGKGWVFRSNVNHILNSGLSEGFNQTFVLWNAELGKKFMGDKAEINISAFDMLKQNQSIQRSVTGSYIEDRQTQILTQFFMLNLVFNIRNFGNGQMPQADDRLNRFRQMRQGSMGRGN